MVVDTHSGGQKQLQGGSLHVAIMWPRPRQGRWRMGLGYNGSHPDQSDALLCLEHEGFRVSIEDCTPFPLNPLARMHEMWSGLDPLRAARLLVRYRRYDVVVGVGDAVAYLLVQLKRVTGLRCPIVLIDPALSHTYPRRKWLQDRILPYVNKVVVFGRVQLEYLAEQYGDQVDAVFVPHRMDTEFYCPCEGAEEPEGSPYQYILSVGDDAGRDFETLVQAMELIHSWGRLEVRCIIKTRLPVRSNVPGIELLSERCSWVDLRELYRRAAIIALPLKDSIHAGGINTLLESMSVGKAVVVSNSQGVRDYVSDRTVVTVEPGNAESLARHILQLLDNRVLAEALGWAARQWVVEHCEIRRYSKSLAQILRDVVCPPEKTAASPATDEHCIHETLV